MKVVIRHTADCPNRSKAADRLAEALRDAGLPDAAIEFEPVADDETARRLAFRGSPTILVDGRELFAETGGEFGLACRLYPTPDGLDGVPSVSQLRAEIEKGAA